MSHKVPKVWIIGEELTHPNGEQVLIIASIHHRKYVAEKYLKEINKTSPNMSIIEFKVTQR